MTTSCYVALPGIFLAWVGRKSKGEGYQMSTCSAEEGEQSYLDDFIKHSLSASCCLKSLSLRKSNTPIS